MTTPNLEWITDDLLDALKMAESSGRLDAISYDKNGNPIAYGPYQIRPSTARSPGYGVEPILDMKLLHDPVRSRRFAKEYLTGVQKKYPDWKPIDVVRSYNAGPGTILKSKKNPTFSFLEEAQKYPGRVHSFLKDPNTFLLAEEVVEPVPEQAVASVQPVEESSTPIGMPSQESAIIRAASDGFKAINKATPPVSKTIDEKAFEITMLRRLIEPNRGTADLYRETREAVKNAGDSGYDKLLTMTKDAYKMHMQEFTIGALTEATKAGLSTPTQAAEMLEIMRDVGAEFEGLKGTERILAESAAPPTMDRLFKQEQVASNFAWSYYQQFADKQGFFKKGLSWLTTFLVPDTAKDLADLVDGSVFSSKNDVLALIADYWATDPFDKPDKFKAIFDWAAPLYENNHVKLGALVQLFHSVNPGEEINVGIASDALDIVTSGTFGALVGVGKDASKGLSLSRKLKKMGNERAAGEASEAAVETNAVKTAVNRSPFNMEEHLPYVDSTDGLSKVILDAAERIKQNMTPVGGPGSVKFGRSLEEVEKAFKNEIKTELLQTAGNKLSREDVQRLTFEVKDLEHKLKNITEADVIVRKEKGKSARKAKKEAVEEKATVETQERATLEAHLSRAKDLLKKNDEASAAEADLSRIEQGIIPDRYQRRLEAIRSEFKSAGTLTPSSERVTPLKTSQEATGKGTKAAPKTDDTTPPSSGGEQTPVQATGLAQRFITEADAAKHPETTQIVTEGMQSVQTNLEPITNQSYSLKFDALMDSEKKRAIDRAKRDLQDFAEKSDETISDIELIENTTEGFKLRYRFDRNGIVGDSIQERKWVDTDVGTFMEVNDFFKKNTILPRILGKVLSPETLLRNIDPSIVKTLRDGGLQTSRIRNELIKQFKDIDKGATKQEILAANELIAAGDEGAWKIVEQKPDPQGGKIFTIGELKAGVVQVASGKRPYTDKEIELYYKKIAFGHELWSLRNYTSRRVLEFENVKEIAFSQAGKDFEQKLLGKVYDSFRGTNLVNSDTILAPQLSETSFIRGTDLTDEFKKELSDKGFKPVRLLDPASDGEKRVKWAIVKDADEDGVAKINPLPKVVLNYIPGAMPRIYKPGYHFVKDLRDYSTVRAFERQSDALEWAERKMKEFDAENARLADSGEKTIPLKMRPKLDVFEDRDFEKIDSLAEDMNFYGGTYTGGRKRTQPLLLGPDSKGQRLERLDYGDAMQRYINNISDIMPLNEYRYALKNRWINSVNELAKAELSSRDWGINPKADWRTAEIHISDKQLKSQLENTRDYIKSQFKIWDDRESKFNDFMVNIANLTEGKRFGGDKISKMAITLAHKDPVNALRGAAFQAHLGWFNLRQLYIQAQNAALAVSMHPIHGMAAAGDMVKMRGMLWVSEEALDTIKKENTLGLGHLVDDVREFRRSGMVDSILKNADYNAAVEGLTPGTMSFMRNAMQKGLLPYEQGELVSRLMAWNIAKRNLGMHGKKLDDAGLRRVLDETFRLHMDLQSTNAAWWQRNMLAIPTQFMQVQAKLIENFVQAFTKKEGTWTSQEAISVLAGQIAFYGTLGVPLVEDLPEYIADKMGISLAEFEEQHPLAAEALVDGAWGMMFELAGFKNQFGGDTASLVAGLDDNAIWGLAEAISAFITNDYSSESFPKLLTGPTGNTIRRGSDVIMNSFDSLRSFWEVPTFENFSDSALLFVSDLGALTSTWSNARKAVFLHNVGELYSRNGSVIIGKKETANMNIQTIIGKAIGFPLDAEASYYSLSEANRNRDSHLNDIRKSLKQAIAHAKQSGNTDRLEGLKYWLIAGLSPTEQRNLLRDVLRDARSGRSELDKEVQKYLMQLFRGQGRIGNESELINIKDNSTEE